MKRKPPRTFRPARIVSGGQTGVDRGALEAAMALGIPHGGWCPQGRLAEDGIIPAQYQLQQTDTADYARRTELNVLHADATLIVCRGQPTGGTELTLRLAERYGKPYLVVDLQRPIDGRAVRRWLARHGQGVLNVAGPRESQCPGIQAEVTAFLTRLLGPGG
ncbi:MAG: putative molybdenum carrier protein [Thermoguttaceae bacterium]